MDQVELFEIEQQAQKPKHNWKYTGTDSHKGEDWYKCTKCGAQDWIAYYGEENQLMPKECNIK